jgi:hypothetical protein
VKGDCAHTKISVSWSSGISVSFSPWCFGITSWQEISQADCDDLEEAAHGMTSA